MEPLTLVLYALSVASFLSREGLSHKCIHDEIAARYPRSQISHYGDVAESIRGKRQVRNFLPYRISVNYGKIDNPSTNMPIIQDPNGGFQRAINYLQSVLSVDRAPKNLVIPPKCTRRRNGRCVRYRTPPCGPHATVPDEYVGSPVGSGVGVDADYVLFVTVAKDRDCRGSTLAYASCCYYDDTIYKPLAGYTNICPGSLKKHPHSLFMLMLHEILHAIGFSSADFKLFLNENGLSYDATTRLRVNGARVLAVNSPKVLSYAREYYSCPNLKGVLLENEGGSGSARSHWESRTLSHEIMIAASTELLDNYTSISNFTLNILEDSGWYKVNYTTAESLYSYELLWGKGLGCGFVTADCDDYPYSCSPVYVNGCSYDYQAEAYCGEFTFYDNCRIFEPRDDSRGDGFCNSPGVSITRSCFPLNRRNRRNGRCYNRQCYRYSSTGGPFYKVTRENETRLCPFENAKLTFSNGVILTCPPAELVCARNTTIVEIDSDSSLPSSWCDSSCATCSRPVSPAHCLTCSDSMTLRGTAPSVCTSDSCSSGTYLNSMGNCSACASGCRACTGPSITECLACEDETLYRVTTDQGSVACIPADGCSDPIISTFGDRTCEKICKVTVINGTIRKRRKRVTVRFSADDPTADFKCKLETGNFKPCSSPKTYRGVRPQQLPVTIQAMCPNGRKTITKTFSN
ncbi:ciliated left-right organizer metallopeptidase-like [Dysidea avara]|uniref:ciliated left-right organizer metallopeptidase-like n=1 Tax=Dysidea avara TaxID=196820 RepID=UPI00331D1136